MGDICQTAGRVLGTGVRTSERFYSNHSAGNWKPMKFPYVIKETHYNEKTYGPWFYSLPTFNSTVTMVHKPSTNCYTFYSNNSFLDGQRFDMKGETAKTLANNHNNVTELEVYLVKGWRLIVIIFVFYPCQHKIKYDIDFERKKTTFFHFLQRRTKTVCY